MDNEEIVYADKDYRKKIIIGFILVALATAVVLHYSNAHIDSLILEKNIDNQFKSIEDAFSYILFLRGVITIGYAIIGIYCVSIGYKTLKSNRFPPRGMKVIRDTKIKGGSSAKAIAYGMFVCGFLLITLSNIAFWYMHKVFDNAKTTHYEIEELIKENKTSHNNSVELNADQR
jgi:hypothetical protein